MILDMINKNQILTFLMLFFGFLGFSQTSNFSDNTIYRADTVFYDEGMVNYISLYPTSKNVYSSLVSKYELTKKVFQYDKCGNLRNVTEVSEYKGQINSCHDFNFIKSYEFIDKVIKNVECEEYWVKPFIRN